MSTVPTIPLNNGRSIPQLGFGVWQVPDEEVTSAVGHALATGYRSVDTAAIYGNEKGTGQAIAASGLPREELFITTKAWKQGHDTVLREFDASLERLGLEYVDLYLLHWPMPAHDLYVESWRALERIHAEGRARSIGVSNFLPEHLDRLLEQATVVPAINQIELHPQFPQQASREYHRAHGIVTEAWSPLGQGKGLLDHPTLGELATKHGRSPAQVVLRWHLQLGHVVIPKSVTPARIEENFAVFDFTLDDADLKTLDSLDEDRRLGSHPATMNDM